MHRILINIFKFNIMQSEFSIKAPVINNNNNKKKTAGELISTIMN